jgi:hypothetical protein
LVDTHLPAIAAAGPIDDAIGLWFVLAVIFTLFVAIDIRRTPEALVMKVGFVVVIASRASDRIGP